MYFNRVSKLYFIGRFLNEDTILSLKDDIGKKFK